MAAPFEIAALPEGGMVASNGAARLQLLDGGRVFRRRAVKAVGTEGAQQIEWAVAEHESGVRVYFNGSDVVVTTRDMLP